MRLTVEGDSLPSYASLREEVVGYLTARFGIGGPELERLLFLERGGEVWAATCRAPETLSLARPEGLRALRRVEGGWKPTSALLEVLGRSITAARLEVEGVDELCALLRGQEIPTSTSSGFVAISFRGDVLGCALARNGRARALIPTGRRQELLEALAADRRLRQPDDSSLAS
jgi:NOL1/NOP2/fmu family ribosome biogenesis protein